MNVEVSFRNNVLEYDLCLVSFTSNYSSGNRAAAMNSCDIFVKYQLTCLMKEVYKAGHFIGTISNIVPY